MDWCGGLQQVHPPGVPRTPDGSTDNREQAAAICIQEIKGSLWQPRWPSSRPTAPQILQPQAAASAYPAAGSPRLPRAMCHASRWKDTGTRGNESGLPEAHQNQPLSRLPREARSRSAEIRSGIEATCMLVGLHNKHLNMSTASQTAAPRHDPASQQHLIMPGGSGVPWQGLISHLIQSPSKNSSGLH